MPFEHKVFRGSPTGAIVESVSRRPDLSRDEVAIEVTHSGVCGTDEHFKYRPIGFGHEGIGVVKAVGPDVVNLKVSNYHFLVWHDGPTDILAAETESAGDT
jgi:Zn-dependent alcohol dehydrogenase